jgi:hypothetical protein
MEMNEQEKQQLQEDFKNPLTPSEAWPMEEKPKLNDGQQYAHDRTVAYVTGEGENLPRIILIRGYAGTGKTFTVNRIIDTLKSWSNKQKDYAKKLSIAATAPTHKAVRVMRKNAELGSSVNYATLHSLLKLKPKNDEKTGKKIFVRSTDPSDGRGDANVIFVDEVSMLGDKSNDKHNEEEIGLWTALLDLLANYPHIKLILLGDPVQIPPVNEVDSPVFLQPEKYGIEVLELTQSMRQTGDNPILDYATDIRNTYKNMTLDPRDFRKTVGDAGVDILPIGEGAKIDEILESQFGSPEFKADADYMKVIAWTNATVNSFNNKIRRMLYAVPEGMLSLPLIVNGEKLIMDDRYVVPNTNGFALPTNEELEVVSYEVLKKAVPYKLYTPMGYVNKSINPQVYQTKARFRTIKGDWKEVEMVIAHERAAAEIKDMMEKVKKSCFAAPFGSERSDMWKHFFFLEGIFAKVKYNYAVTAHKSQGSTYTNCMLAMWDIVKNPRLEERNRIIYVGATRAKKMLYIIN